ncbi:DMT family transporter [Bacillus safensis]|uniref:DMT family transporter n=1 Tax=Bacillus safensis TaxID=561879 RepID=UPI002280DFCE|nr:DMT family transporter [Bacillus safensis]MCY7675906.1 DMT family transporter [Bacillus safensis]MCY7699517.1 DMT family transporter [Bacillus safensis]MEC3629001.1 DMT family transporter [Bacillus safensis]
MKGVIFALLGGACITLQGVANARISQDIGTWQAATITQLTGFMIALIILLIVRDGHFREYRKVKPLYLVGGGFAAIIIFNEVTAIQMIGVTLTIAALLIAQLAFTFAIDAKGWFGVQKKKMKWPHYAGILLMIAGVIILKL